MGSCDVRDEVSHVRCGGGELTYADLSFVAPIEKRFEFWNALQPGVSCNLVTTSFVSPAAQDSTAALSPPPTTSMWPDWCTLVVVPVLMAPTPSTHAFLASPKGTSALLHPSSNRYVQVQVRAWDAPLCVLLYHLHSPYAHYEEIGAASRL